MIYTVTMNPSLDMEMNIERLRVGATNRSVSENITLGGKGINVSVVLKALREESVILSFVAGFVGEEIERRIHKAGLDAKLIHLNEGNSRINVKVNGTSETELNGSGAIIPSEAMKELFECLAMLEEKDILVLSGSIPASLSKNLYATILSVVSEKNVSCVVDATGELLMNCLQYHPFLIKPNRAELEEIFDTSFVTTHELVEAGRQLQEKGARNVLISLGRQGAILVDEDGVVHTQDALHHKTVSTIGAGDAMVAGFIAAYKQTGNYGEAFRVAMASGCASAFSKGFPSYEAIRACYDELN